MTELGMTKEELESSAALLTGGAEVEQLETVDILRLVTIGQYLTDRCLAELEKRNELELHEGQLTVPYMSEHSVECWLTR